MKITDLSILCKWENLTNRQCIKYLFAPLYIAHPYNKGYMTNKGSYYLFLVLTFSSYCPIGQVHFSFTCPSKTFTCPGQVDKR